MPESFWLAAGCLSFGAVVQSTLGFGMGVVSIPLMVWGGLDLPTAIGVLLPNVFVQTAWGCYRLRARLPWRTVGFVVSWRFLGLPLGILLLGLVAERGQAYSRGMLGIGLLLTLAVQKKTGKSDTGTSATSTALYSVSSGVLAGLIGMGGPALVLWSLKQPWAPDRQRAFLWLCFLIVTPVQILLMLLRFGTAWSQALMLGIYCAPLILLISAIAGRWAENWSRERLRWGMQLFLLAIALRLLIQFATNTM